MPPDVSKTNDQIPSERLVHFVEFSIIHYGPDDVMHIVGLTGVIRHDLQ